MAEKTIKQWLVGGPPAEYFADTANRLTKEFVDFHNKKFEKPNEGSKSEEDKLNDNSDTRPM